MVTRALLRLLCLGLLWPAVASAQVGSVRVIDGVAVGQADVIGIDVVGTEQGLVVRPIGRTDNSAFTAGTTPAAIAGGFYHATRDAITDGNSGAFAINVNRAGLIQLENSSKVEIGTQTAPIAVRFSDATNFITPSAVDTDDGTIAGGQTNVGLSASLNYLSDGTNWTSRHLQAVNALNSTGAGLAASQLVGQCDDTSPTALTENSFGNMRINCTTHALIVEATLSEAAIGVEDAAETAGGNLKMMGTVRRDTAASSAGATGDNATLNTDANGKLWTNSEILGGAIAHDAADSGNPLKIGAKATSSISAQTMVATADRTDLFAGLDGVLIVRPYANIEDRLLGMATITDGSSTSAVAASGAGIRNCVTNIVISNSSATNVTVDLRDGTAGAVAMTIPAAANMGGAIVSLLVPMCFTANTAVAVDPSAAASTITTTVVGFKAKL